MSLGITGTSGAFRSRIFRSSTGISFFAPVALSRRDYTLCGGGWQFFARRVVRLETWKADGVSVVNSVDAAAALAEELNYKEIFVIGGGQIYMIAFDQANKIYMTRVHADLEGDTYFPVIEKDDWKLVSKTDNPADEKHAYAFSFQLWERKSN